MCLCFLGMSGVIGFLLGITVGIASTYYFYNTFTLHEWGHSQILCRCQLCNRAAAAAEDWRSSMAMYRQ